MNTLRCLRKTRYGCCTGSTSLYTECTCVYIHVYVAIAHTELLSKTSPTSKCQPGYIHVVQAGAMYMYMYM